MVYRPQHLVETYIHLHDFSCRKFKTQLSCQTLISFDSIGNALIYMFFILTLYWKFFIVVENFHTFQIFHLLQFSLNSKKILYHHCYFKQFDVKQIFPCKLALLHGTKIALFVLINFIIVYFYPLRHFYNTIKNYGLFFIMYYKILKKIL